MAAYWSHVHFPWLCVRACQIGFGVSQSVGTTCKTVIILSRSQRVKNVGFFFFVMNHPWLLGKQKQSFEEHRCLTWWRRWQMTTFVLDQLWSFCLYPRFEQAHLFSSDGNWSPQNRRSPHEILFVFYLANCVSCRGPTQKRLMASFKIYFSIRLDRLS